MPRYRGIILLVRALATRKSSLKSPWSCGIMEITNGDTCTYFMPWTLRATRNQPWPVLWLSGLGAGLVAGKSRVRPRTGWGSHDVASSLHRLLVPRQSRMSVPMCIGAVPCAGSLRYPELAVAEPEVRQAARLAPFWEASLLQESSVPQEAAL